MMVRLLYASRCGRPQADDLRRPPSEGVESPRGGPALTQEPNAELIEAILRRSREHNPRQGITGLLCHDGNVFMQVLEGGREPVNQLYNAITQDPRHHDVTMLHYEEITERRFAGWTMGQVNLSRINPSLLLKYSEKPELDPFAVSGKVSMALLDELIATAAIVGRGG